MLDNGNAEMKAKIGAGLFGEEKHFVF